MRARTILMIAALCLITVAVGFAENPQMGTWKLNEAKSKIAPGSPKNTTVVYAAAGDEVKVTTDGTGTDGSAVHTEWTGKFDGKDYPLTGDPTADMRSYKMVNDHTLGLTNKKDGKVTTVGQIVVSPDGKSRTLTVHRTGEDGKKTTSAFIYDKE